MLLCCLSSKLNAQNIFIAPYQCQAKTKVFVVKYASQADLLVYVVNSPTQTCFNSGYWYFTDYKKEAEKSIYFVKNEKEADLKIYFVKFKSLGTWIKRDKKILLK